MTQLAYTVGNRSGSCFTTEEFLDPTMFRDWLLRDQYDDDGAQDPPGYRLVYSIVQEMSRCRFLADETFNDHDFMVRSRLQELPLAAQRVEDMFMAQRDDTPPETVITRIAERHFHTLDTVLTNIRKQLRRERELTRLSNIQQLDNQCLVWMTRQPGVTAVQKAGSRQKLMAVVRKESYDILENRVLKAVFSLCASYAHHYLREYGKRFANTDRLRMVQRLYALVKGALHMEELEKVPKQRGIPQPNYVLMHDRNYSQIWRIYLDLLRQTALMEQAWRNRHQLFRRQLLFSLAVAIRFDFEARNVFFDTPFYWFSPDLRYGAFLRRPSLRRLFLTDRGTICEFLPCDEATDEQGDYCACFNGAEGDPLYRMSAVFLPRGAGNVELPIQKDHTYFVFDESDSPAFKVRQRTDIIVITPAESMFYQADDWLHSFRQRWLR